MSGSTVGESVEQALRDLTGVTTGESPAQVYAIYTSSTLLEGDSLESIVHRYLTTHGKAAQVRENLLSTLYAGGATGESVEATLRETGLTGWV